MNAEGVSPSYRVELPEFEGPLDLLLHLCKTHEIDIVNIPIAFITEKYLEYLDLMQSLTVDLAADYLVMAATLAYLKSRELVPAPEPLDTSDEDGEEILDPREELIRRLLEYQKYKDAAARLGERPIEGRNIFGRGMEIGGEGGLAPLADHSVWRLIEAFGRLLEKAGPKLTHEVAFDRVSISARVNQIIDRLESSGGSFRFDALFDLSMPEAELRSHLVVTLLAILELARLKVVRLLASDDEETLFITQVEGASADMANALANARRVEITSAGGEGGPDPAEAAAVTPATVDDHESEAADPAGATAGSVAPAEPEAKEP
jgi:segregation and condensation protein A